MFRATAFLIMLLLLLVLGGTPLVGKFLRGYFRGMEVYVILTVSGNTVAYKNPSGLLGHEDKPLDMIPNEILHSDQYGTYYNVCWFECGTLFRCEHSTHRTRDEAMTCKLTKIEGYLIGKVLEEQ
jgi:hypothetical protein